MMCANGSQDAKRSDVDDWSHEFRVLHSELHSFLEQQFARQHELLRDVHERVKIVQHACHHGNHGNHATIFPMTSRKTSIRTSVIREDSVYHDELHQESDHDSIQIFGLGEEEVDEEGHEISRQSQNEDHGYEGRPRRQKLKRRDSARHSFVRRTLEAHKEKADKEASKLKYLRSRSTINFPAERSWLASQIETLVASKFFTNAIMCLILMNVILLGIEVDVSTILGQNDVPKWFGTVNSFIVMIFVLEVCLKCVAVGFVEYWCGHEACWNAFDALIITVSVFETVIDIWAQSMSADVANSSHLRVVRTIPACILRCVFLSLLLPQSCTLTYPGY